MSTSDAGELELTVVGGETATPPCRTTRATRNTTAREQQDESSHERFKQENHHDDEIPTGQQGHPSAIRQEETHKALILRADRLRKEEAAHCGDSKVQTQKRIEPRFTSCLLFRFSRNPGLEKPEQRLKKNLDPSLQSLTEPKRAVTENRTCQVNGQTSPDSSIKVAGDSPLSERIPFPAKKKEEVIKVVHNELGSTRDLSITQSFSNGEFGPQECNGSHILRCVPQPRTSTRSAELEEDINHHTKLENHTDHLELSNSTTTMLSSTVVTVLAPHWNGRLRRTKRPEGTGDSETQGNVQDVTNTAASHGRFQETMGRSLTDGSQEHLRVPFLGTRRNTVGWSTKSDPANLDYGSKRKMIQTVSLDVNSGRMDNRKLDADALSRVPTTASPLSPLFLDPNEQRKNPQTGHQGGLPSLGSKPTTSSLLLSLRRVSSNGRNSNAGSTLSEINPSLLSSSPSDRDGKLLTTHLSQTFLNNNGQERSKPPFSSSSISYRTADSGPVLSPSSSNQRERNTFETHFFSASPVNTDKEDTPFSQQPQTISRTQFSLSCSKQAFLSRQPSERQETCRGSDKSTNLFSDSSASSPRHSSYDRSALLKTHALPRRTTLTSTSWWKKVTQEDTSPQGLNDTMNMKEKTPFVPPDNDDRDLASVSPTDKRRFSCQLPNNRDNNNTTESVCKGNMNLLKKQGGTHNLKQRNAEDSPDHKSDKIVKEQYGSNLKNREPRKLHSLPDVLSSSKISRATEKTALSHPKDPSRDDVNNGSFTANVTELPPTLLNPKSPNTPTESSSQYNNHCTSKTNTTHASSHNKDSQKFTKPPLSPTTTNTPNSQALTFKTTSGLPLNPNTKTSSSFHSHPVASQTHINASSYTGPSSQTPKFTNTACATPLGFERTYASIHKPFHHKTVSSLISTVSASSQTNCSSVSTASTSSAFTTGNHPTGTTAPSPSIPTPPVTPAIASFPTTITTISSLLTPPATPIITSPTHTDPSSPKEGRPYSDSPESDPKKLRPRVEGKRVRRVTWEDSVDLKHSEPSAVEKPETSEVPASLLSPSRSPQSVKVPSIFSFLRSTSQTTNISPLCSPSPKTSSIRVVKGGKYRSLSSDSADLISREQERSKQRPNDTMTFDQGRRDLTTPRQERTLSVESGTVQYRSSAPLSLPPDFSSGYKLRYSSTPYSTLMSTRSTQGETKTLTPRSPLFQQSQSNYTPHHSIHTDPVAAMTLATSKPPVFPINLPQSLSMPFQNRTATQGSTKCGVSETDQFNNNHSKNNSQDRQNGQIVLVDNRLHKAHNFSSTCVTETLVYNVKSKVETAAGAPKNTTPKTLQHTANTPVSAETKLSQQSHRDLSKEATRESQSHSDQSSSGSSSTESQPPGEGSNRRMKESILGKSRFFSVESNNEQSPKRSRFALKKSVSIPNSSLSRSESERASKTNNKMDQVLNRLRQTFSTRRSEDDILFPWKWKRASQTPSVGGSSDVSDITAESTKKLKQQEQEKGMVLKDNEKGTEDTNRWTQNRYTLIPPLAAGSTMAGDELYIWSDKSTPETDQDDQNACGEHMESQNQPHLTIHSPTRHSFDFYKDETDYKPANQFLSCRDPSPGRNPNPSAAYPAQLRKSTSSPRSPFSPFSSLSPVSPLTSTDVTDDSVFYSPKLQRRRESPSPCEPGEGINLGGSRRSRASTGPPSAGPGQDKECLASSYADLKYGIEPGRSFSVSSVLSSRPSGPGRISTGSRFMSVGDLFESVSTGGGTDKDQWSASPDWLTEYDCQPSKSNQMSYIPSDPGKMRSRSLPRSLTRRLANWSSEVSASPPVTTTTSKPAQLWSPNMNTCHFAWDTEGPPTPPPTPPLSPVSRRMSKPPSPSSPTFPGSSGAPQQVDSQSPRGHLPSRGYVSSLSTFEESSDSSSDTTTDDEYYLEINEDEEKETEL